MKKSFISITAITVFISMVSLSACKKEESGNLTQKLTLHIHNNVGSNEAEYGTTYTDLNGRKFNISDWRYYVSNIVLINSDGSERPINDTVFLVSPEQGNYVLGQVPVGNYQGFRFLIGVDSTTNHSDPATYPAGNPLAIQDNPIHWSWNSGYIFMKLEGQFDSTANATDAPNKDFFYHIGLDENRRTIDFTNQAFTVTKGYDKMVTVECDLRKVWTNVNMLTENSSHSMMDGGLATKIADNWSTAFTVE